MSLATLVLGTNGCADTDSSYEEAEVVTASDDALAGPTCIRSIGRPMLGSKGSQYSVRVELVCSLADRVVVIEQREVSDPARPGAWSRLAVKGPSAKRGVTNYVTDTTHEDLWCPSLVASSQQPGTSPGTFGRVEVRARVVARAALLTSSQDGTKGASVFMDLGGC